jgi:hypothetical protein
MQTAPPDKFLNPPRCGGKSGFGRWFDSSHGAELQPARFAVTY